jgi:uncharacterized protein (DUF58 family)
MLALTLPVLVYWAFGLWWAPDRINLQVQRELSEERVGPSLPARVSVEVLNAGNDLEELALDDLISTKLLVVEGSPHHLISLREGERFAFEYQVQGPRGGFAFETLHVEASDDMGLLRIMKDIRTEGQLSILPAIVHIKDVPIRPRRTRVYAGAIPARIGGAGVEFFGVRDYEPGDSRRSINWRVSARYFDDLYSNEFQQERVSDVGIVLDGRERSNPIAAGQSFFEHSVLAAGALADALLRQGNRVGLLVYGNFLQWTLPGYGKLQRERIVHALARAAPGPSQIFEGLQHLPTRLFPSESQLILVSPLLEEDYLTLVELRARGYQILIVSPDPIGFEESHLHRRSSQYSPADVQLAARIVRLERDWLLKRVRRAGVQVVEWDVAGPFDGVMRRSFGKAIRIRNAL